MRKTIAVVLSIPKPCNERWDAMTPVEGGRHCAACQQTVTDFSDWSDGAIAAFFLKPENATACGRYRTSQLDRPLYLPHQPHSLLYRWVVAAGIAAITLAALPADAQTAHPPAPRTQVGDTVRPQRTKPLIQPDHARETPVLKELEIEKMGVRDLNQVIATQPGVLRSGRGDELNFCGARAEATVFIIDGILQTAPPPAPLPPPGIKTLSGEELDRLHLRDLDELPR